jgi:gamma-glutamyltranspeptidase/glutathione hydrolase
MCPCIVARGGVPILAVGGRGGRKIPSSVFEMLVQFVGTGEPLEKALSAPRMHSEGGLELTLEKSWPAEDVAACRTAGYSVSTGTGATLSAASIDPKDHTCLAAMR